MQVLQRLDACSQRGSSGKQTSGECSGGSGGVSDTGWRGRGFFQKRRLFLDGKVCGNDGKIVPGAGVADGIAAQDDDSV